ncbi:unnamed protein product [Somion occarium]|uniref:Metaxin glutathione S-transferase domain-containing protein n=1 Tax=Somion occarium TaxID=3059160 RepID=A0ABP1DBL6_9APHY
MTATLPPFVHNIFTYFPLHTYPPIPSPHKARTVTSPELWIHAPRSSEPSLESSYSSDLFSSDVECLKWQAYIALRGLTGISVRWDIQPEGAIEGRLPNLRVPLKEFEPEDTKVKDDGEGELLPAHLIMEWVDKKVGNLGDLEGYVNEDARDESRAWVKLLEGDVHAALEVFQPAENDSFLKLLSPYGAVHHPIQTIFTQPLQPLTGWSSLIRPYGVHIDRNAVELKYKDAISALSERLGTDKWFLGSASPTALDALLFAYLHCLLHSKDHTLRFEITRRVNLVAWERRVHSDVRAAFQPYSRA